MRRKLVVWRLARETWRKGCLLLSGWWKGEEERYQNITSCYLDNNYYNKMVIAYLNRYIYKIEVKYYNHIYNYYILFRFKGENGVFGYVEGV